MPTEILNGIVATYGLPVAFGVWLLWNLRGNKAKEDPNKEILAALQDLKERMVAVETILEERK